MTDEEQQPHVRMAVDSLLEPLSTEQQRLVDVICNAFFEAGDWPVFDYVESVLDANGLDAAQIVDSLPSWSLTSAALYSTVWSPRSGRSLMPEDEIAVTIAGLQHCRPKSNSLIECFLTATRFFVDCYLRETPTPTKVRQVEVSSEQFNDWLLRDAGLFPENMRKARLVWLPKIVKHEPISWGGLWQPTAEDPSTWTWTVRREIRHFRDVGTIEEYLKRMGDRILLPPRRPATPAHPSSLSVTEAIDYLDTVWRLRFKRSLFDLPGATKTSELALDCATSAEFQSRISAVADLLARIRVEDPHDESTERAPPLQRLKAHLARELPVDAQNRAQDAVETLRTIVAVRAALQHQGRSIDGVRGFEALGLPYPPRDWGFAWDIVRARAVEALNSIRDELQASDS